MSGAGQRGPVSGDRSPKYAGLPTFMRLPLADPAAPPDVVILGVPFDGGTSVRPGSRFGPRAIREASTMLRPFHPGYEFSPFDRLRVADGQDVAVNPLDLEASLRATQDAVAGWHERGARVLALGGRRRVAVMCAEIMPQYCHRAFIADALVAGGVQVLHLVAADDTRRHTLNPAARQGAGALVYDGGRQLALGF